MKKVFIIDQDQQFRDFLIQILSNDYEVIQAFGEKEAFQRLSQNHPDLLILDSDQMEVCLRLRRHPSLRFIPVLMISGLGESSHRALCLDSGADDVVDRAFSVPEFMARVRALLRGHARDLIEANPVSLGNLEIHPSSLMASIAGRVVDLTPTEFDLVRYFVERPERAIARKQLLGDLWPDSIVTRRTVDTHIANLRKKLAGFDYQFETVYGSGYRLSNRRAEGPLS